MSLVFALHKLHELGDIQRIYHLLRYIRSPESLDESRMTRILASGGMGGDRQEARGCSRGRRSA